ncbi:SGNH/GDSL hydrolase family protein [Pedobacter sp. SAFR-022]|uniref:SGNH/GDSL hydrolase family protein n=1 Tax=Pedobacter sp. SAFR-022 TaxID=3436861 RepID=UPI003F7EDFB8
MMKKNYVAKSLLALVAAGAIASCKPSLQENIPSNGEVDFSRYIAVGNSLTAGYADGGLYLEGQQNSFPEILAKQFKAVGGGDFNSPFFSEAQANGSGYLQFNGFGPTGSPIMGNVTNNTAWTSAARTSLAKYDGTFNNYGVPEMKVALLESNGYASNNVYFARILGSAGGNSKYMDFVEAAMKDQKATFFSFWEGQNDILGFAYTGGSQPLTPVTQFETLYNRTVNRLIGDEGRKGVVGTIGDVLGVPYFNVVTLKALQGAVAAVMPNATFYVRTGANTTVMADSTFKFTLPLSSSGLIGVPDAQRRPYGLHPGNPITSNWVLDPEEQAQIKARTNEYNAIIKEIAALNKLAIVDIDDLMNQFATPKMVNGAAISTAYITGNIFSLDGIHPTPLGNAITANAFIKAINQQYKASVPIVNIAHYRGVKFPAAAAN